MSFKTTTSLTTYRVHEASASLVWEHLLECGQTARGHTLKENCLSPRSHEPSTAPQQECLYFIFFIETGSYEPWDNRHGIYFNFIWHWDWKPGLLICWASPLLTEPCAKPLCVIRDLGLAGFWEVSELVLLRFVGMTDCIREDRLTKQILRALKMK